METLQIEIVEANSRHRLELIRLLESEALPVDDLPPALESFVVAINDGHVIGVAGLEVYDGYGLLRSLAVHEDFRNLGIGGRLLKKVVDLAKLEDLESLYLLTETAPEYFNREGFSKITRDSVPDSVRQSSEFSHVCPQSAIVMQMILK